MGVNKPIDVEPIRRELKWLSNQLRLQQFLLKAHGRKRKELDQNEAQTRQTIKHIKDRVRREIEIHPEIVKMFVRFD